MKNVDLTAVTRRFSSKKANRAAIEAAIITLREQAERGLHLGCGGSRIANLINCDAYDPSADMKVDATDLSAFETGSVDYIESNHMIEHLGISAVRKALAEWQRALCKGGILVITCPEFRLIAWKWCLYSILSTFMRTESKLDRLQTMIVGSQEHDGMFHRSVFDRVTMPQLLSQYGFESQIVFARYPLRTTPSMVVIAKKV